MSSLSSIRLAVLALALSSAAAFVPASVHRTRAVLRSTTDEAAPEVVAAPAAEAAAAPAAEAEAAPAPAPAPVLATNSLAIPFLGRPALLDGQLAGDFGFDPLGFADSRENLAFYADAEVKHARLAMLCAAGWPLSELWHTGLAKLAGAEPMLASGGRAPSVLNGGILTQFNGLAGLALLIAGAGAIELLSNANKNNGWGEAAAVAEEKVVVPGELGFDPFGLYEGFGGTPAAKKAMRTAELKNGRTAMVAVFLYVVEEFSTGKPVTELTPWIFKPFWEIVVQAMGASAY